jgi:hypothetical protein
MSPHEKTNYYLHQWFLVVKSYNVDILLQEKKSQEKKSQEKKSQYIFSTFTIPRKVTVCIMSDFVHTQVMVFIATFKNVSVIWWLTFFPVTFFLVTFFPATFFPATFFSYLSCDFFFLLVLWLFILWLFSVYHLCIAYIISHLLEEMYENQISVLLKFHVPPWKDKLLSASVIFVTCLLIKSSWSSWIKPCITCI